MNSLRVAAFAGSETCRLRRLSILMKPYIFGPSLTRGTGRAAIDAGRFHRIDKAAIKARVTAGNSLQKRGAIGFKWYSA